MKLTPYYQDDFCTIFHGDCREILPTLPKVDLVLTDPPYGIGADSKQRNSDNGYADCELAWTNITPGRLHWSTDAGILRVADGIPNRVQRIKCLGNSVVPQIPFIFAKAIYQELTR